MAQVLEIASLKFEYFLVYLYWDQKVFMFYKHMNMFAQNKSKTAAMTNIIVKVHTKFPLHFLIFSAYFIGYEKIGQIENET